MHIVAICSLFSSPMNGMAEEGTSIYARELVKKGFEQVRVAQSGDTLFVGIENRAYRWEPRGVAEVLALLMPLLGDSATLSLTCLKSGIPLVTVVVTKQQYLGLVNHKTDVRAFASSIKSMMSVSQYQEGIGRQKALNSAFLNPDITISPLLRLQLGNFDHPLEMQFNIVPGVSMTLVKGMTLSAQVILPIYNNLNAEGGYIRPGIISLSQVFRLPYNFFATVTAGYFTRERYGLAGQLRTYFFNGKVSVGASAAYTSGAGYNGETWIYNRPKRITWSCDATWRWSKQDLTVKASAGRFIAQDFGWRVDVSRQFGEVSIGFFAMLSGGISNGGFNFIVPLPPRKYSTKHRVRVRPGSYVPWEYRAKGLPPQGRTFSTGGSIEEMFYYMNADYVRNYVGKEILRVTR